MRKEGGELAPWASSHRLWPKRAWVWRTWERSRACPMGLELDLTHDLKPNLKKPTLQLHDHNLYFKRIITIKAQKKTKKSNGWVHVSIGWYNTISPHIRRMVGVKEMPSIYQTQEFTKDKQEFSRTTSQRKHGTESTVNDNERENHNMMRNCDLWRVTGYNI